MSSEPVAGPAADIDSLFQRGYDRLYADDAAGAARAFAAAVSLDPGHGEAWAALAEASGSTGAAARVYAHAVAVDPEVWMWRAGLAEALRLAGSLDDSIAAYRALSAERADSASVRLGHARALNAAGRSEEALDEYREAVALRPDDAEAALELAEALTGGGDALAAVELLQPLSRRAPDDAGLHHAIGRAWIALREPEKALAALRRTRALDPDDRLGAAALIAALEAGEGSDLSAAYVRALFDRYADRFDQDLLGKLGYAAPELLRAAVDRVIGQENGQGNGAVAGLRVFDLGCGTGLAGIGFRPLAGFLAGVDLSPRMVEKARERALYDDLRVGDVVAALDEVPDCWDLLVAADVLVYLGDLAPVFAASAKALVPGGRFAATVERSAEDGFTLGPTRRYAHAEAYVRATAEDAGLTIRLMESCTPRREKGVGVPGLLFVVERPSAPPQIA
ncbi:tetratricopeptide repeat protein [Azospirillum doebereinerae]|uniref:tetratricopeptide repeat protein n=1 Tax=Azospirillum doebereinerae TaxID=92933 RepID=UPI001EE5DF85|nr:tetratricopeptide repeat protein [Azospirillum doebereinerae]